MATTRTKKTPTRKERKKRIEENVVIQKIRKKTERYANAEEEIKKQYRDIKVGGFPEDMTLRLRFPSPGIESSCNKTYSQLYGQLYQDDDFLTEKQIIKIATKRGDWSDEKEENMKVLQEKVSKTQALILLHAEDGMTQDEIDKLTSEYEHDDEALNELIAERFALTSNSLEVRCQEMKIKDQVWQCIVRLNKDGSEEPLWNSLDEIESEQNRVLVYRCINECIQYWQGLPSDFLEDSLGELTGDNATESAGQLSKESSTNQ